MSPDALPPGFDLCTIPLAPNPNGSPPNFVDPPDRRLIPLGVGITFATISAVFVTLRLLTNFKVTRKLAADDYLCLLAFVLMSGYAGLCSSVTWETARHLYDIPVCRLDATYAKRAYVLNLFVGPALWASKAAIVALYIRLFAVERWLRITSYITVVVLFLAYWSIIPVASVFCTPKNGGPWDATVLARCGEHLRFEGPFQGAIAIAADIFILCLPLPILWKLNLPTRKKISLGVVFLVGIFTVIVSCISMYYRVQIFSGIDSTWNTPAVYATTMIEGYITIICSCSPATYSFWTNYFTKSAFYSSLSGWTTKTGYSSSSQGKSYAKSKGSRFPASSSSLPESLDNPLIMTTKNASVKISEDSLPGVYEIPRRNTAITKSTIIEQRTQMG